jgi:hypothetical protein
MTDAPTPTPEREKITDPKKILEAYHQTVNEVHAVTMEVIAQLPIHPQVKQNALMFYDTGLMWIRQGINMIKFNSEEEKQAVEAQNPQTTH